MYSVSRLYYFTILITRALCGPTHAHGTPRPARLYRARIVTKHAYDTEILGVANPPGSHLLAVYTPPTCPKDFSGNWGEINKNIVKLNAIKFIRAVKYGGEKNARKTDFYYRNSETLICYVL